MTSRYSLVAALVLIVIFSLAGCNRGNQPAMVGQAAPDFILQDGTRQIALHDFRGKMVVLNFWATWCPPCVEELPSLLKMQEELKNKNVVVLAVSVDVDQDAYQKFLKDHGVTAITAIRDGAQRVNDIYGTHMFPETYIIDRNGVLQRKIIGPTDWTAPDMIDYLSRL